MLGPAAVVFAQLLAAAPPADEPAARDPGALAVALAEARAAYAVALAENDFREDAPAVRAVAESVAPTLVEAWRAPARDETGRAITLRNQAVELMQATAGEGLRAFLAQEPGMRFALARPWLRWHDDPGALAELDASDRGALLRVVALYHPDRAADPLLAALRDADPAFGRDGTCHSALLLPPRARRAFVEGAMPTLTAQAPRDNWPACIRLAVEHPAGRRWLERAVVAEGAPGEAAPRERWAPVAAALLVASGPADPRVAQRLAAWGAWLRAGADSPARREVVLALERQSPLWPDTAPARRGPVLAFVRAAGTEAVRLWPLRRALGDPSLFADAVAALSAPAAHPSTLAEAVRVVGLTAPPDAAGRAAAGAAFDLLRSRLRPWAIDSVSPRELDRWRAAVDEARPCAAAACAASLVTASDAMAARVVALGGPIDDPDVARVVVRRVVAAGEEFLTPDGVSTAPSALAAVVLTRPARCPPPLRGLTTARPPAVGRFRSSWLDPWRERLVARCTLEARVP